MIRAVLCISVMATACATTHSAGPSPDAPTWTKYQCMVRDGTMHAIGSSNFSNPIIRREDAELAARGALADCLAGHVSRTHDAGGTTTRSSANTEIADSAIATRWVDPESGIEYALAVAPVQQQ